jgi:divalent metal cation (Fe/Co/Zn/Cd) transporter
MVNWKRAARWLVAATLAYNAIEAAVALWAGEVADSIALIGFGLDSVIECAAAVVMLRHLLLEDRGASPETLEASEHRAHRFIGFTLLLLAAYVGIQAGRTLWLREAAAASLPGILLAALSAVIMPVVAYGKLRAARALSSPALRSEAMETLACAWLSVALLVGLAANAWAGWWWADPAVALSMVPWLIREGNEGIRGDRCCDGDSRAGPS